jgi:hypothetical protein
MNTSPATPREAYDDLTNDVAWPRAFTTYFGVFPSEKSYCQVDWRKVDSMIESKFGDLIREKFKKERYERKSGIRAVGIVYLLSNRVIVVIDGISGTVDLFYSLPERDFIIELDKEMRTFCKSKRGKQIFLAVSDMGITLKSICLKKIDVSLPENYNDDLLEIHANVLSLLSRKNKSELFLFHGRPGTGKSTYIRHLIYNLKKRVIFLPPNVAGRMDAPEIANLIINNPNSIIIIEDAEELIVSRNQETNSAISMLLNLTDGLLGYCLGIQFICTFNTGLSNIDKALLRKGRLSALYEFKALSAEKSRRLMLKLGKCPSEDIHQPMALADIFNHGSPDYGIEPVKNFIGFTSKELTV